MTRIITDTTAVLPSSVAEEFRIPIVPQLIHFGSETFTEGADIDVDSFLSRLKSAQTLPKTAAPPPDLFREHFERMLADNSQILCLHPSTDLSGTVRSASVAAQDFPHADIRVVDTRLVGSPLGTVVHRAAEWAREGTDIDSLEARVKSLSSRAKIFFLVATLDYLARGGRIGGAEALLGNALQLKPILTLEDGQVEQFSKERTMKRAVNRLQDLVLSRYPGETEGYLSIMHADSPGSAHSLADFFQDSLDIPPPQISTLPPAIMTHAGPGALAVAFFQQSEIPV